MPSLPRFSAWTVALSYVAVSCVVLLLFATPVLYAWHEIVEERSTERLGEDAQRLASLLQSHGVDALKAVIDSLVQAQPQGDEKFIVLADAPLTTIAGNLPAWPHGMPTAPGTYMRSFDFNGRTVRAIFVCIALPEGYKLAVGRNTAKFQSAETYFWVGLIGAAGTVLLFGVFGGLLIRSALLAEVQGISKTAAAIVAGDLSRRLPTHSKSNELDLLAQTVNRMLDQIERLIHGIRNVSNSIAHDLRTPLTELRSRLEELALARPPIEQTFAEIDVAVADVDRVIAIFNALLRLAEIDSGARRSGFVSADVAKVVSDAVEFYQPLAELHGIALTFTSTGAPATACDPLLLAQAVGNLIDNALKYAEKKVKVSVESMPNSALAITVTDDGPGVPDAEKPKVVERFYRSDVSRGTPGVGLGLSLVAAVAKLHGGALMLTDAKPGLLARLTMYSQIAVWQTTAKIQS